MATLKQILDALLDRLQPVIRDAFYAAVADVTDEVILKDLIAAIELNDYQRAFKTLGMSDASMRPITAALENVFEQGGVAVGGTFPKVLNTTEFGRTIFRFDVRNSRAERWLRDQSSSLITRIQEDARVNIMNALTINLGAGNNPRRTALDIVGRVNPATGKREGGIIGLTQDQELWVRNARNDLETLNSRYMTRLRRDKRFDSIVQNAIDTKTPIPQETIDKLLIRYKNSLLKLRGENVGRTETIQSLNRSQYEATKQAIDMGAANPSDVQREWDDAGDKRVRHSHHKMNGQRVGIDEPFVTPGGEMLMFPGDNSLGASAKELINCRCRVRMRINWLAGID